MQPLVAACLTAPQAWPGGDEHAVPTGAVVMKHLAQGLQVREACLVMVQLPLLQGEVPAVVQHTHVAVMMMIDSWRVMIMHVMIMMMVMMTGLDSSSREV